MSRRKRRVTNSTPQEIIADLLKKFPVGPLGYNKKEDYVKTSVLSGNYYYNNYYIDMHIIENDPLYGYTVVQYCQVAQYIKKVSDSSTSFGTHIPSPHDLSVFAKIEWPSLKAGSITRRVRMLRCRLTQPLENVEDCELPKGIFQVKFRRALHDRSQINANVNVVASNMSEALIVAETMISYIFPNSKLYSRPDLISIDVTPESLIEYNSNIFEKRYSRIRQLKDSIKEKQRELAMLLREQEGLDIFNSQQTAAVLNEE